MYRVKEIDGKFIPQVGNWFNGYLSIDRKSMYLWNDREDFNEYCKWDTLQEALDRVKRYRPSYHKVTYHKIK